MLLKCIKDEALFKVSIFKRDTIKYTNITVGKNYLVLEKYRDAFRIVDDYGELGIYPDELFEVISDDTSKMVKANDEVWAVDYLTHTLFIENGFSDRNIEGFWGYLFETGDIEAYYIVQKAIDDLNSNYRLPIKPIWHDGKFETPDPSFAKSIRSGFVRKFIDTDSEIYKEIKKIDTNEESTKKQGGLYLRNAILTSEKCVVKYDDVLDFLKELDDKVFVMWDIRRKYSGAEPDGDDIYFENNPKFKSDTVLSINSVTLSELIRFDNTEGRFESYGDRIFPENLYIFDDGLDWYIAITNSFAIDDRICYSNMVL